jgi:hypothetical protein
MDDFHPSVELEEFEARVKDWLTIVELALVEGDPEAMYHLGEATGNIIDIGRAAGLEDA